MNYTPDRYQNRLPYSREMGSPYRNEEAKIISLFRWDAENEFGFSHMPDSVKESIHRIAWEKGHASGLREVWMEYDELAELCVKSYNAGKEGE